MTKNTITPTKAKLIKHPAGPPLLSALPEPTSNPGPIMPTGRRLATDRISSEFKLLTSNCDHLKMARLQLSFQGLGQNIVRPLGRILLVHRGMAVEFEAIFAERGWVGHCLRVQVTRALKEKRRENNSSENTWLWLKGDWKSVAQAP